MGALVILEMDNIAEVIVYGEKNPIIGNIACAKVRLIKNEDNILFINRLNKYCKERLQSFKVPVKVKIMVEELYSERHKKIRNI